MEVKAKILQVHPELSGEIGDQVQRVVARTAEIILDEGFRSDSLSTDPSLVRDEIRHLVE